MKDLLPHYERELTFLRKHSKEFAERYPKIASRLLLSGETCEDPHIERMIESFALLSARVHKKLEDEFPELTEALLGVLYPHYLRPLPSCSIARFEMAGADAQLPEPITLPRGTELSTRPVGGVTCRFRTAYDVALAPLRIASIRFEQPIVPASGLRPPPDAQFALNIELQALSEGQPLSSLKLDRLRVFIDGEPSLVCHIREALFSGLVGVAVGVPDGGSWQRISSEALKPVGFDDDESLLHYDARSHLAYRLLTEFFLFPAKFDFFDIDLRAVRTALAPEARSVVLKLMIGARPFEADLALLERVSIDNFQLGCTPVVNLFQRHAEPIRLDHTRSAYPVVIDARRASACELYGVERVFRLEKNASGERAVEFRPFYGLQHAETERSGRYWHLRRNDRVSDLSPGFEYEIAIVEPEPVLDEARSETLSIEVTATNRNLPSQLPYGLHDGDLFVEGGSVAKRIRFKRRPTQTAQFKAEQGGLWRLVSHLALNRLSLADAGLDALKEMLCLYNTLRSATNQRVIDGLKSISHRPASALLPDSPFPAVVRGIEIEITVDEQAFVGIGLSLFVAVLERFFALYVHLNSFVRLLVRSDTSGELLFRCKARSGDIVLV